MSFEFNFSKQELQHNYMLKVSYIDEDSHRYIFVS